MTNIEQPRPVQVLFLPNVRQTEKVAAFRPGHGPDPDRRRDEFRRQHVFGRPGGDLNPFPWNPLARMGSFYAGFDPLRAFRVLLLHRDVDVVVSVFESNAVIVLLLARLFRFKPKVVLWEVSARGWKVRDRVVDFVARRADAIFVLTRHQESLVVTRYGRPDAVARVGFAVDEAFFAPPSPRPLQGMHVLAVGDDEARDYTTLMEACSAARQPLKLRSDAELPNQTGVTDWVTRVARVSYPELRVLYAEAQIVAVPLRQADHPSGITAIYEAMAMGCALIASDTPTSREIVEHGVTGWLVPSGDVGALRVAIETLRDDAALRRRLGDAARLRIETELSNQTYASRFAKQLRRVANGH